MANKINPFDPNVNSGLYKVHFPDFAFWMQKTQPLVYDDALSYYEVLCRIASMLNQLIKQVNDLTDAQKKFIEDATKLLNQIISEWNSMVDEFNTMKNEFNTMKNEFSNWRNTFNQWSQQVENWRNLFNEWEKTFNNWGDEFNSWRTEFDAYIKKIDAYIKKIDEFIQKIENEWNDYKTEINNAISNVQGDVTNVNVSVDVMPIKKHGHVNIHAAGSEHSDTNYGSMDWYDLIYPEVTIRFISAIISATFNAVPEGVTGAKRIGRFVTENVDIDDPNFTYLVDLLSNPAFGGASVYNNTKNIYYPAVINFPKKPSASTEYEILVPSWATVDSGDTCLFYIYEGGKTQLGTTTPDWYKNNVREE